MTFITNKEAVDRLQAHFDDFASSGDVTRALANFMIDCVRMRDYMLGQMSREQELLFFTRISMNAEQAERVITGNAPKTFVLKQAEGMTVDELIELWNKEK